MNTGNRKSGPVAQSSLQEQAAGWFLRLREPDVAPDVVAKAEIWRAEDPAHEAAWRQVRAAWQGVGDHAAAPEMMAARRDALARAGKAARKPNRLWRPLAIAASLLLVSGVALVAYQFMWSPAPTEIYATGFGEIRVITLPDNSRVALDAETRLTVAYSAEARRIELIQGQAHFDVAREPVRPFRVKAGNQTVVALGTAFNIELVPDQLRVTLLEGRVAVAANEKRPAFQPKMQNSEPKTHYSGKTGTLPPAAFRELVPGEQLVIKSDGVVDLRQGVNLEAVDAWRQGKLIFEAEPLSQAVARVNKYSRIKLSVEDPNIESIAISGVFDAGDTEAFVEAVTAYFSIKATRFGPETIWLTADKG